MTLFNLSSRSTTDIVVLCFTILVCVILTISAIGIVLIKALHPEMDFSKAGESVNNILATIVGALVGFISGRIHGRHEAENGGKQT